MTLKGYILPSTRAKIKVFFILFGCSACGILVPWLGIKPMPPAGQVWRPNQWKWKSLNHVWFFVTPWTIQSLEFSRPEYWSGQPFPSAADLPDPGIEPGVSFIAGGFFTNWAIREAWVSLDEKLGINRTPVYSHWSPPCWWLPSVSVAQTSSWNAGS